MTSVEYLDFEIEIGLGQGRDYPLAVIRSPGGEARERMLFPFDELALASCLKDLQIALLRSGGKRRQTLSSEESTVQEFGQKLFDALLSGEVRSCYDVSQREAARRGLGLRIKLRIQPPELTSLPWEFLYDARRAEYICLSTQTPLVRYIELSQVIQPLLITPPLRILGLLASPIGLARLDTENEKARVEQALKDLVDSGQVQIDWLEHANRRDLQRTMRRGPWHILHFIGHGGFDPASDEGFLALETERGELDRLPATQLARLLADHVSLRLAVLNSCDGAQGGRTDVFSSTASLLVRRGIPAVLAMQYEITDRAAIEFARGFYEALADDLPVDAATAEARKSVSLGLANTIEWGTPVLFMRAPDGIILTIDRNIFKTLEFGPTLEFRRARQVNLQALEKLRSRLTAFRENTFFFTLEKQIRYEKFLRVTSSLTDEVARELQIAHPVDMGEDQKPSQVILRTLLRIGNYSLDMLDVSLRVVAYSDRYELDMTAPKVDNLSTSFDALLIENNVRSQEQAWRVGLQLDEIERNLVLARADLGKFDDIHRSLRALENELSNKHVRQLIRDTENILEKSKRYWPSPEEDAEYWEAMLNGGPLSVQRWFDIWKILRNGENLPSSEVIKESDLLALFKQINEAVAEIDNFRVSLKKIELAFLNEQESEKFAETFLFGQDSLPKTLSALMQAGKLAGSDNKERIDALLKKVTYFEMRCKKQYGAKFPELKIELERFQEQCNKVLEAIPTESAILMADPPFIRYPSPQTENSPNTAFSVRNKTPVASVQQLPAPFTEKLFRYVWLSLASIFTVILIVGIRVWVLPALLLTQKDVASIPTQADTSLFASHTPTSLATSTPTSTVTASTTSTYAQPGAIYLHLEPVDTTAYPIIMLRVNAWDSSGSPLKGISPADFIIQEDNDSFFHPSSVQADVEAPLSIIFVLDISGSMAGASLQDVKVATAHFLDRLKLGDRAALVAFSDPVDTDPTKLNPERELAFTSDLAPVYNLIEKLTAQGQTQLYNAEVKAVRMASALPSANRAVLLLSDGRNEPAEVGDSEAAVLLAKEANIPFFVIGLGEYIDSVHLRKLASETGGIYRSVSRSSELPQLFSEMATLLKSQYLISYSSHLAIDGTMHSLKVALNTTQGQAEAKTEFGTVPGFVELQATPTPAPIPTFVEVKLTPRDDQWPIALLSAGLVIIVILFLFVFSRKPHIALRIEICGQCGFDLTGKPGVCPQCGSTRRLPKKAT